MEEEDKFGQVLGELRTLTANVDSLTANVDSLTASVEAIKTKQQVDGVKLEQLGSDIKAVAEGHFVIRAEMQRGFDEVKEQIGFVDVKVEFLGKKVDAIDKKIDEHIRQPAHA